MDEIRKTYSVPVRVQVAKKEATPAPTAPSSMMRTQKSPSNKGSDWDIPAPKKKMTLPTIPWHRWFTKKNVLRGVIVTLAFVVALAGILTAIRIFTFSPSVAGMLPSSTLAFVSLNVDPLNNEVRAAGHLLRDQSLQDMISPTKLIPELQSDIFQQSHIRDVTLSVLPTDHGTLSRVLIFHLPQRKHKKIIDTFVPPDHRRVADYKGVQHYSDTNASGETLSHAVSYGNMLVISDDPSSLYLVTDVMVHDAISLAKTEDFHDLSRSYSENPVLLAFVQSEKVKTLLTLLPPLSPWTSTFAETFVREHPLVASFGVDGKELTMHIVAKSDDELLESTSVNMLQYVPKNAIAMIQGANFAEQTKDVQKTLEQSSPLFAFYFQNLEQRLKKSFDFDIQEELLSQLNGPFVIFVDATKSRMKTSEKLFHDVGVVITLNDEKDFTAKQQDLESKVQKVLAAQFQDTDVDFQEKNVQDTTIHILTSTNIPAPLYYAVRDGRLFIATSESLVLPLNQGTLQESTSDLRKELSRKSVRTYYLTTSASVFEPFLGGTTHVPFNAMMVTEEQKEGTTEFNGRIPFVSQ